VTSHPLRPYRRICTAKRQFGNLSRTSDDVRELSRLNALQILAEVWILERVFFAPARTSHGWISFTHLRRGFSPRAGFNMNRSIHVCASGPADTSAQGLPVGEEPVKQIRVLMITMPRLQTDVIQSALTEGPRSRSSAMWPLPTRRILQQRPMPTASSSATARHCTQPQRTCSQHTARLTVIGLVDSGRRAVLFDCRPVVERLGDASPHDVIVGAARTRRPEVVL
jgi:hypothetical protein